MVLVETLFQLWYSINYGLNNEFGREEKRNSQLLVLVSQEYNYPDQSRNSVGEDDKLI